MASNRESMFQPLVDYLAASGQDEVVLTFKEIAAMIGGLLPESAILTSYWWMRTDRSPITLWTAIGWRAHADRDHLRVIFTRNAEEGRDE